LLWISLACPEDRKGRQAEIAREHLDPDRSHPASPGSVSDAHGSRQLEMPCNRPGSHQA